MKSSYLQISIFILIACILLCPEGVRANGEAISPPKAPFFVPTSGWLVGPATPDASGAPGMPCLMAGMYNNGYSFRVSADSSSILVLAIDFRQEAFTPNETYPLKLTISGAFEENLEATAYNKATLLLNVREYPSLYSALKDGEFLNLTIGGREMAFALPGVSEGLERVADCSGGGLKIPEKPDKRQDVLPQPGQKTHFLPVVPKSADLQKAPASNKGSQSDILVNYESPADTEDQGVAERPVRRWRAMAGANLREIFEAWTASENVKLLWNAGRDFSIPESLNIQGTLEEAVMALLQQYNAKSERPTGKIFNNQGKPDGRVLLIELEGQPD